MGDKSLAISGFLHLWGLEYLCLFRLNSLLLLQVSAFGDIVILPKIVVFSVLGKGSVEGGLSDVSFCC